MNILIIIIIYFLKIDIEGGEFSWFQSLSKSQMDNISQMLVEFHFPYNQLPNMF